MRERESAVWRWGYVTSYLLVCCSCLNWGGVRGERVRSHFLCRMWPRTYPAPSPRGTAWPSPSCSQSSLLPCCLPRRTANGSVEQDKKQRFDILLSTPERSADSPYCPSTEHHVPWQNLTFTQYAFYYCQIWVLSKLSHSYVRNQDILYTAKDP